MRPRHFHPQTESAGPRAGTDQSAITQEMPAVPATGADACAGDAGREEAGAAAEEARPAGLAGEGTGIAGEPGSGAETTAGGSDGDGIETGETRAAAGDATTEEGSGAGAGTGEQPGEPRPWVNPIVEGLRGELAAKDEQLRGYITAYKQAVADMERERERLARQRETILDRERMDLAGRLLAVLDDLDRSLAGCRPGADAQVVGAGLQIVRDGFQAALSGLGVERIAALGSDFDAKLHEAVAMIPATGHQADQEIVFEERPGYTFKGKLLRATRAIVASRPE